ncbi:uncharacterized protein V6R79_019055 [Siganus canaliculatus]
MAGRRQVEWQRTYYTEHINAVDVTYTLVSQHGHEAYVPLEVALLTRLKEVPAVVELLDWDVHVENILIEYDSLVPRVRIIDFGCGSFLEPGQNKEWMFLSSVCLTVCFMNYKTPTESTTSQTASFSVAVLIALCNSFAFAVLEQLLPPFSAFESQFAVPLVHRSFRPCYFFFHNATTGEVNSVTATQHHMEMTVAPNLLVIAVLLQMTLTMKGVQINKTKSNGEISHVQMPGKGQLNSLILDFIQHPPSSAINGCEGDITLLLPFTETTKPYKGRHAELTSACKHAPGSSQCVSGTSISTWFQSPAEKVLLWLLFKSPQSRNSVYDTIPTNDGKKRENAEPTQLSAVLKVKSVKHLKINTFQYGKVSGEQQCDEGRTPQHAAVISIEKTQLLIQCHKRIDISYEETLVNSKKHAGLNVTNRSSLLQLLRWANKLFQGEITYLIGMNVDYSHNFQVQILKVKKNRELKMERRLFNKSYKNTECIKLQNK